jgi:hypothetical protein
MAVADAEGAPLLLFLCAEHPTHLDGYGTLCPSLAKKLQPELEAVCEESRAT